MATIIDPSAEPHGSPRSGIGAGLPTAERQAELEAQIADLAGVLHATNGALVELLGTVIDERAWEGVGIRSAAQWLAWRAGLSLTTAHRVETIARRRDDLPTAIEALVAGELSIDALTSIARHVPTGFDQAAVELARYSLVSSLERLLPRYAWQDETALASNGSEDAEAGTADADDSPNEATAPTDHRTAGTEADPLEDPSPESDDAPHPGTGFRLPEPMYPGCSAIPNAAGRAGPRTHPVDEGAKVSCWWDDQQRLHLNAVLPTDEGLAFEAALAAARHDLWADTDAGDPSDPDGATGGSIRRPPTNRAALHHLVGSYLAGGANAQPTADRYRILAHLSLDPTNTNQLESHLGPVLPAYLRRHLTCDCSLTPIYELLGNPVAVGRSQRIVPDRLRRLIEHRDHGCAVPGCAASRHLHIHHITHWEDGGTTGPENLIALCQHHHRLHHLGWLPISGNPEIGGIGGLRILDRHGRLLTDHPATHPPPGNPRRSAAALGITDPAFTPATGEPLDGRNVFLPPNPSRPPPSRAAPAA